MSDITALLQGVEADAAASRNALLALLIVTMRALAARADDPAAFLEDIRRDALDELEAMKFQAAETAIESQTREVSRTIIAGATQAAKRPPAGDRLRERRR